MGLRDSIKIRIEPGLYEWLGFYSDIPDWCSTSELLNKNFNIDEDYEPLTIRENLRKDLNESVEDHYERHFGIVQKILKESKSYVISARR